MKFSTYFLLFISCLLSFTSAFVKSAKINTLQKPNNKLPEESNRGLRRYDVSLNGISSSHVVAVAKAAVATGSSKSLLAQGLGFVMAGGAFMLYTPILFKLWQTKTGND